MKQLFTTFLCLATLSLSMAQTVADFENFNLMPDEHINDAGNDAGFTSGNIFLPNSFESFPNFDAWSGWAISSETDTETPGFMNQFSAVTGSGYDNSTSYALFFSYGPNTLHLQGDAAGGGVEGMYITNGTYAYLSMMEGDDFAKKFGGTSGNDPDYFYITFKAYLNGELGTDSINFYLADYRFDNNDEDYIIDDWTYLDLSSLGNADSLYIDLFSSDAGQAGINTPAYFFIDNVTTLDMPVSTSELVQFDFQLAPNPAHDWLNIRWNENGPATFRLLDPLGRSVQTGQLNSGINHFDIATLPAGMYFVEISHQSNRQTVSLVKR